MQLCIIPEYLGVKIRLPRLQRLGVSLLANVNVVMVRLKTHTHTHTHTERERERERERIQQDCTQALSIICHKHAHNMNIHTCTMHTHSQQTHTHTQRQHQNAFITQAVTVTHTGNQAIRVIPTINSMHTPRTHHVQYACNTHTINIMKEIEKHTKKT